MISKRLLGSGSKYNSGTDYIHPVIKLISHWASLTV